MKKSLSAGTVAKKYQRISELSQSDIRRELQDLEWEIQELSRNCQLHEWHKIGRTSRIEAKQFYKSHPEIRNYASKVSRRVRLKAALTDNVETNKKVTCRSLEQISAALEKNKQDRELMICQLQQLITKKQEDLKQLEDYLKSL